MKSFIKWQVTVGYVLFIVLLGCSDSKETRVQRLLLQGNEMIKQQNYEQAIRFYEGALKIDSCFADAWNNLGTVYYNKHDYPKALEHYNHAITCQAHFTDAYLNRANAYFELNELYSALKDLKTVEQMKPDTMVLHFSRGLIYTKLRDFNSAVQSFRKALKKDSSNSEIKINIATLYYYKRDFDSAKMEIDRIVSNEKQPYACNMIEAELGNYDKALFWVNKAIALQPNDAYFLNNRGYIYLLRDEIKKGEEDINKSMATEPYNAWAHRNKGIFYLKMRNFTSAIRLLKQAIEMDPYVEKVYVYLAEAYFSNGEKGVACEQYEKALEREEITEAVFTEKCR
jgi:tetratricopeptide (TPR) repeat protein